jgi:hypothetical protein
MHQFHKFILSWNSACFRQFICPSSGVYSLYTQQWYVSYRFVDSFQAGPGWNCSKAVYKPVWHIPLLSVQWIISWWWTDELSKMCRVSWQNKFVKLVHLVGFITKKFVMMHGHMNVKISDCIASNDKMTVHWSIEEDLDGGGCSIVLTFVWGNRGSQKKLQSGLLAFKLRHLPHASHVCHWLSKPAPFHDDDYFY